MCFLYPYVQENRACPKNSISRLPEDLVRGAIGFLPLTRGYKVLCTKPQLQDCMLRLAREAYAMGYLSDRKEHSSDVAARPAWMDIRLDDPQDLVRHNVRLRPVVVDHLIGAATGVLEICAGYPNMNSGSSFMWAATRRANSG